MQQKKKWYRRGLWLLGSIGATYLLVVVLAISFESRLVFPAAGPERGDWELTEGFEEVELEIPQGPTLVGRLYTVEDPESFVVYYHGNGGNVAMSTGLMRRMGHALRANVLCLDYRGYGRSTGFPTEEGVLTDGLAAYDYMRQRFDLGPGEIVVYGRSLGGGVATHVAVERRPRAVVLDSTFDSIADVAARRYPLLPVKLAMRNQFRSIDKAPRIECPVFQMHRIGDRSIAIEQARKLHAALLTPHKQFVEIAQGGHNTPVDEELLGMFREFVGSVEATDSRQVQGESLSSMSMDTPAAGH